MKSKVAVVLSGGGMRGAAHIGFLKALSEQGLTPDYIAGSSAGALVGALYAGGHSFSEMLDFFRSVPLFSFSTFSLMKPGWLNSDSYSYYLKEHLNILNFEDLKTNLIVATTSLENGEIKYFDQGGLIKPLLATAALPPIFTPVDIDGHLYIDGGILNNFPYEPLCQMPYHLLGSYVNPISDLDRSHFSSSSKVVKRAEELVAYARAKAKFKHLNYVLEYNDLEGIGWLDSSQIDKIYEIGYHTTLKNIEAIKNNCHGKIVHMYPKTSVPQRLNTIKN